MKEFILVACIIIFFLNTVNAQLDLNFGIKGGINFSNLSSDLFMENDKRTAYHLGILAEISLGNTLSLQPEIMYSKHWTGATIGCYGCAPKSVDYYLDYVQIPILAKIYAFKNLSFEAGPSFNFLVQENLSENESDFTKSFEINGGIGIFYNLNFALLPYFRYKRRFSNVFDESRFENDRAKNSNFQLGVEYLF